MLHFFLWEMYLFGTFNEWVDEKAEREDSGSEDYDYDCIVELPEGG